MMIACWGKKRLRKTMPNIHCRQANTQKTLSQSVPLSRHLIHLLQTTSISACYLVVFSTFHFAGKVAVVVVLNSAIKPSANWSVSAFRSRLELKNKAHKRWRSQVKMKQKKTKVLRDHCFKWMSLRHGDTVCLPASLSWPQTISNERLINRGMLEVPSDNEERTMEVTTNPSTAAAGQIGKRVLQERRKIRCGRWNED